MVGLVPCPHFLRLSSPLRHRPYFWQISTHLHLPGEKKQIGSISKKATPANEETAAGQILWGERQDAP